MEKHIYIKQKIIQSRLNDRGKVESPWSGHCSIVSVSAVTRFCCPSSSWSDFTAPTWGEYCWSEMFSLLRHAKFLYAQLQSQIDIMKLKSYVVFKLSRSRFSFFMNSSCFWFSIPVDVYSNKCFDTFYMRATEISYRSCSYVLLTIALKYTMFIAVHIYNCSEADCFLQFLLSQYVKMYTPFYPTPLSCYPLPLLCYP